MELEKKILRVLEDVWPFWGKTVEEVAAEAGMSRSSVFNYLKILEAEGKVESRKAGKTWLYRLVVPSVGKIGFGSPSMELMRKILEEMKRRKTKEKS